MNRPSSYLGIASCALFAIATGLILSVIVASWFASHKLAGYEIVVLGPMALLVYIVGLIFAVNGMHSPGENPGSRLGLILNVLPFVLIGIRVFHGWVSGSLFR